MALIECYECGKTISDKAKLCPSCGAPASNIDLESYINNNPKYLNDTKTEKSNQKI